MDSGRKLEASLDNPFDDLYIRFGATLEPGFYALGFTPNTLTGFSALFGVAAIGALYHDRFFLAAVLYFISYLFDCFDGHYARAYGMVSEFGDWFDHIKDVVVTTGLLLALVCNTTLSWKFKVVILGIYAVLFCIGVVVLGCQEVYYQTTSGVSKNEHSASLGPFKALCQENSLERLRRLRWFGVGTATTAFCVMLAMGDAYSR